MNYYQKYIKYKSKYVTTKIIKGGESSIWYFSTTPYDTLISNKITNALNGHYDTLNTYNDNKNIFDLLYYKNNLTYVHIINLIKKEVIDMSSLKIYHLLK